MKKIDGKINILISRDSTTIEVIDKASGTTIVEAVLTPEQLSSALSRLAMTPCQVKVTDYPERIGKTMEHETFEFELPEGYPIYERPKGVLGQHVLKICPEGWIPDLYFGSQDSFFNKGDERWARTTIRRWV